ncbi:MAG: 2Fe-2S iron-sulfur cluster binding domain-containing protein [Deltaproteobacteria bacterium]|nr:2Fe-2S iron-sulfur cluster binding domain-containing protein [Deltaproteobacteria bacterium]
MTAGALFSAILGAVALQLVIWAVVRALRRPAAPAPSAPRPEAAAPTPDDRAWRAVRVVERQLEDAAGTQLSLHLAPTDGRPLGPGLPGQHLSIEVPVAGGPPLVRCYSLSGPAAADRLRITVKRAGQASTALHERAVVGDVLRIRPPSGRFVFAPDPGATPVLVAGGVGITPLIKMLHNGALEGGRPAHLYYGVRDHQELAFRAELAALRRAHPALRLTVVYSRPDPAAPPELRPDAVGHVDLDLLRRTLPAGRHRFYVCGPPAMMAALLPALRAWGVAEDDLRAEAFGPAAPSAAPAPTAAAPQLVQFVRSGRQAQWTGPGTLLELAEAAGVGMDSGCRAGSCGTCEVRLRSGAVSYLTPPDWAPSPGACLPCVARPTSAVELDA